MHSIYYLTVVQASQIVYGWFDVNGGCDLIMAGNLIKIGITNK